MTGAFFLDTLAGLCDGRSVASKSLGKNPLSFRRLITNLRTTYEDVRSSVLAYSANALMISGSARANILCSIRNMVTEIYSFVNDSRTVVDFGRQWCYNYQDQQNSPTKRVKHSAGPSQ